MDVDKELALVEEAMELALCSDVDLLATMAKHIIRSGGKRFRPRVVLCSYRAVGGDDVCRIVPLASAVELVHTASLIHDDINDHNHMRRGHPTLNSKWGNSLALLAGDFIFVKLLKLMATFDPRSREIMVDSCISLVEGEARQTAARWDIGMTEEMYLEIVGKKTAALFAACAELGGVLGGGTAGQLSALKEYGFNLGMTFQIRDDTLDLVGEADELGKPVASDLAEGKLSLASLFALRKWGQPLKASPVPSNDALKMLLRDTGAIDYAMLRAGDYCEKAKVALLALPSSEAKVALYALTDFAINRDR